MLPDFLHSEEPFLASMELILVSTLADSRQAKIRIVICCRLDAGQIFHAIRISVFAGFSQKMNYINDLEDMR
jgi:hypothetical protein